MIDTIKTWTLRLALIPATLLTPGLVAGQGISVPTVSDTQVGYIDGAMPGNQLRLRYDAGFSFFRATRAEFFYAKSGPDSPGLPKPEPRVDFQDIHLYGELLLFDRLSAFVELPIRFLNPDVNDNTAGVADMTVGGKWAFWMTDDIVASFQLRTYIPNGEAKHGLGTNHVSLEPALLCYARLTERTAMEGEFRYWIPIGGTDFAGSILRYGLGIHTDVYRSERLRLSPVLEFVGWTVLDGKEGIVFPSGLTAATSAAGDTIVYVKTGLRVGLGDNIDIFAGYGRPLTGDRWYDDVARVEMRIRY